VKSAPVALADPDDCHIRSLGITADDYRYTFYDQLMRLAISKMDHDLGTCVFDTTDFMSHTRKFSELQHNRLDIVGNVSSTDLEEKFQPVKIPVYMGLHGVRLLVVKKGQESKFSGVKTLDDLRTLMAGVVHDWQVADVLHENGLPISTNDDYESLFRMLDRGRIDYIPLAIFEAVKEVARRPQYGITVEPNLLLLYPSTDYFFVNPQRPDLRERLTQGLQHAIADGSRDQLIEKIYGIQNLVVETDLSSRQVISLTNAANPADAPRHEPTYWYRLDFAKRDSQ
jgi:ABC-type amino acid transport substrate-binding protein